MSLRGVRDEAISWGSTEQVSTRLLRRRLPAMTHMEVIKFLFLNAVQDMRSWEVGKIDGEFSNIDEAELFFPLTGRYTYCTLCLYGFFINVT